MDKFTGDGIMAVFGAPVALEDHAVRACLAALGVQDEANRLAVEVEQRDGVDLRLRVGLHSGQVIAGEVGSKSLGYNTIGEQVGIAQRMESVAPPRKHHPVATCDTHSQRVTVVSSTGNRCSRRNPTMSASTWAASSASQRSTSSATVSMVVESFAGWFLKQCDDRSIADCGGRCERSRSAACHATLLRLTRREIHDCVTLSARAYSN